MDWSRNFDLCWDAQMVSTSKYRRFWEEVANLYLNVVIGGNLSASRFGLSPNNRVRRQTNVGSAPEYLFVEKNPQGRCSRSWGRAVMMCVGSVSS